MSAENAMPAMPSPSGWAGKPLAQGLIGGLEVLTAIGIAPLVIGSLSVIVLVVVAMFLAALVIRETVAPRQARR